MRLYSFHLVISSRYQFCKGIVLSLLALTSACSNQKQQMEVFQLAQVHNQASKKPDNKGLPSHYVMLQYMPGQTILSPTEEIKITKALQNIADKSQYEAIVVGNADTGQLSTSKKVISTDMIIIRLKQINKMLMENNLNSKILYDTQIPSNSIYIEFKAKKS